MIICPSINTKNDLIEIYKVKEDKIKVINIGISDFKNISYQNEDKLDYPYLLYVGYRGKYKNFKNLVIAIGKSKKILKDFKIVCFGGGKFSNEEKNLIQNNNLNIDDFIQIEGDDLKLTNLYKNARAFLFPQFTKVKDFHNLRQCLLDVLLYLAIKKLFWRQLETLLFYLTLEC